MDTRRVAHIIYIHTVHNSVEAEINLHLQKPMVPMGIPYVRRKLGHCFNKER